MLLDENESFRAIFQNANYSQPARAHRGHAKMLKCKWRPFLSKPENHVTKSSTVEFKNFKRRPCIIRVKMRVHDSGISFACVCTFSKFICIFQLKVKHFSKNEMTVKKPLNYLHGLTSKAGSNIVVVVVTSSVINVCFKTSVANLAWARVLAWPIFLHGEL